jgi:pyrroline-5-carboxylate reductase
MKIGFLGVGTVSTAVIEAMASRGGAQETIYLSPRGEKRSTELAAKYDHCIRLDSNQAVIDASDMVVISMLPNQVDEALADLIFREDQIIASFIAGTKRNRKANCASDSSKSVNSATSNCSSQRAISYLPVAS